MAGLVRIQLSGDPGDVAAVLMAAAGVMQVVFSGRMYLRAGTRDVRAFATVRAHHRTERLDAAFADLNRLAGDATTPEGGEWGE
jgi:hypothetical protein